MPRYSFLAECCWLMDHGLYLMFCSQQALIFIHFVNQFSSQHPCRISSFTPATTFDHSNILTTVQRAADGGCMQIVAGARYGHMGRGCGQLRSWSLISYDQWMVSGDVLLPARAGDAKFPPCRPSRDLWTSKWCHESYQISPSIPRHTNKIFRCSKLYFPTSDSFKSTLFGSGDNDEHEKICSFRFYSCIFYICMCRAQARAENSSISID